MISKLVVHLEKRISKLIDEYEKLKDENYQLKNELKGLKLRMKGEQFETAKLKESEEKVENLIKLIDALVEKHDENLRP